MSIIMKKLAAILILGSTLLNTYGVGKNIHAHLKNNVERKAYLRFEAYAKDENGTFIFKNPRDIIAASNGSFFLIDNGQVLKFNRDGKFSGTIVRKGEGPGEATYLHQLYVTNSRLIVNTGFMAKLMAFDFDGTLKWEYKRRNSIKQFVRGLSISESTFQIIGNTRNDDFIVITTTSLLGGNVKDNLLVNHVLLLSKKNEWQKKLFEIPLEAYPVESPMGTYYLPAYSIITTNRGDYIYFTNTARYNIKVYNIHKNKIEANWTRNFRPVNIPRDNRNKYEFGAKFMINRGGKSHTYKVPPRVDFPDIQKLFVVEGSLWVLTSKVDPKKGVLIDVFNQMGNRNDYFYLSFQSHLDLNSLYRSIIYINGNDLFIREIDEEDNYMIVKYNIIGL